jgi:co-chaperonin GroES (HSP10)
VKDINQAKVLAIGPGALDRNGNKIPVSVAAGDKVLIPQVSAGAGYSGLQLPIDRRSTMAFEYTR